MKIYIVVADNGSPYVEEHRRCNVAAFATEDRAKEYIGELSNDEDFDGFYVIETIEMLNN